VGLEPTKNSFAGCCLDRFGIATKLVARSPKTGDYAYLSLLTSSEIYRNRQCARKTPKFGESRGLAAPHLLTTRAKYLRPPFAAINQKTHQPATLAVGRNLLKLNEKLAVQPPRARQDARATRTAAAHRVPLGVETHQR
jgi:hypothetical protein